jgi:hypothetical protein
LIFNFLDSVEVKYECSCSAFPLICLYGLTGIFFYLINVTGLNLGHFGQ